MTAEPIIVPWRRSKRRLTEFQELERWCRNCQEWWPDEAEFWYGFGKPKQQCKACQDSRTNDARRRATHPERDPRRVVMGPAICQGCRQRVWLMPHRDRRRKALVWEHDMARSMECAS